MAQPSTFVELGKENMGCLLRKSLYGLKQSPKQWYKRFDTFVLFTSFKRSSYDGCFYFKKLKNGLKVFLLIYVDVILLACKDKDQIEKFKEG